VLEYVRSRWREQERIDGRKGQVGVSGPLAGTAAVRHVAILLVEDDHGDAVLVHASLSEAGIPNEAITWTRTLADAMASLVDEPGCVLLDLGLPDADGYSAVHKMVEAAPDTAVIVLTGRQERDGVEALAAGAQDYLVKDAITGELLERSIRYAIERKRAQRTQQQLREVRISAAEQARLERGLLPTPLLRTPGIRCATYYRPGRDDAVLGGDFFDVVETTDGRVRAVIGDVMGHGPDEAALGVHLRVAWRTLLLAGTPDEQILPTLAKLLRAEQDVHPRYVTVCDLTVGVGEATVRVAGHPAPVLCVDAVARYPDLVVGPPLGVHIPGSPPARWSGTRIAVPSGTSFLLYTDGLLDAYTVDTASESLGITELVAAVERCARQHSDARDWLPSLVGSAPREAIDDTAAVVLTVTDGR
jgi:serine phosphatase RsbU (regulator of sigma subunit)